MASSPKSRIELAQTFWRMYAKGAVLLAMVLIVVKVLAEFFPWLSDHDNPLLAILIAVIALIALPPLLGAAVHILVNPLLGKWNTWSEVMNLEDRLISEISKTADTKIVIVSTPSDSIRTIGIMTARFPATETNAEQAAVYFSMAPRSKKCELRIVPVSELEITGWTMKEYQLFQWTVGAISPPDLKVEPFE